MFVVIVDFGDCERCSLSNIRIWVLEKSLQRLNCGFDKLSNVDI